MNAKTTIGLVLLVVVTTWSQKTDTPPNPEIYLRGALWGVAAVLLVEGNLDSRRRR